MPRPVTKPETAAQKKRRLANNKARREARAAVKREKEMMEAATQAAEGESDFDALVEAQRVRIDGIKSAQAAKAGAQTPKTIRLAREHLTDAFDFMGGVAGLVAWGRQNPTEFYRIWARLIPKEAAPESENMPLEQLLAKLASRESMSVAEAAFDIGREALEKGRQGAEAEDMAAALAPPPPNYEIN